MKFYLLLIFLSFSAFAAVDPFDLTEEETNPSTEDILIRKPEKYLRDESMIYDLNTDLGIKDQRRFTGADWNRFSMSGHINGSYEHPQNLYGFDATYFHRSKRYNQVWWGAQFFNHTTRFGTISENATRGSEAQYHRPGNTKDSLMGLGIGASYRFKLLLDFYPTEDVFENIDVFINYLSMKENYIDETYKGYGLTASYGIHKRSSTNFFYGGKMAYNVGSVVRPNRGGETDHERALSLGWLSFAFEIGFFY